jgi:hypothetical protein
LKDGRICLRKKENKREKDVVPKCAKEEKDWSICLRKKGKNLGPKCVKDLAVDGREVAEKVADGDQVPDGERMI